MPYLVAFLNKIGVERGEGGRIIVTTFKKSFK
jgi:hypothetical protein